MYLYTWVPNFFPIGHRAQDLKHDDMCVHYHRMSPLLLPVSFVTLKCLENKGHLCHEPSSTPVPWLSVMPHRLVETITVGSGVLPAWWLLSPGNQPATVGLPCPLRGWTWHFKGGAAEGWNKNWLEHFSLGHCLTTRPYTSCHFSEPPSLIWKQGNFFHLLRGSCLAFQKGRASHAPPP